MGDVSNLDDRRAARMRAVGRAVGGHRHRVEIGDQVRYGELDPERVMGLMVDVDHPDSGRMLALIWIGGRGWCWVPTDTCEVERLWSQQDRDP